MPYRPGGFALGPFDPGTLLSVMLLALVVCFGFVLVLSSPTVLRITTVALGALSILAMGHMLITVARARYADRWGPIRSARAVVSRKWSDEHDYGVPVGGQVTEVMADALDVDPVPTIYAHWNFWAAFDVGQGKEEEFAVAEDVYTRLEEGTEGVLTWRGERMLRFVPLEGTPSRPGARGMAAAVPDAGIAPQQIECKWCGESFLAGTTHCPACGRAVSPEVD